MFARSSHDSNPLKQWSLREYRGGSLQEEALTEDERRAQRYVDEEDIPAPSVITLNAVAAAHAVNDYLFRLTGLRLAAASDDYVYFEPRTASSRSEESRADRDCIECGDSTGSRFGHGDSVPLPTRQAQPARRQSKR